MGQHALNPKYTPEEYLAMEEEASYKSEYYDGEIFALAGASFNHNRIATNLVVALENAFSDKPCMAFTNDMRLLVEEHELYTYPDVMVLCDNPEFVKDRDDTIKNPILIAEVLSESTKDYDRGQKFEFYRSIKTLKDYILIDQSRVHIEYFHKIESGKWLMKEITDIDETLTLKSIDLEVPIEDIYNKVNW
jgi:Uma2 family endonuclease